MASVVSQRDPHTAQDHRSGDRSRSCRRVSVRSAAVPCPGLAGDGRPAGAARGRRGEPWLGWRPRRWVRPQSTDADVAGGPRREG